MIVSVIVLSSCAASTPTPTTHPSASEATVPDGLKAVDGRGVVGGEYVVAALWPQHKVGIKIDARPDTGSALAREIIKTARWVGADRNGCAAAIDTPLDSLPPDSVSTRRAGAHTILIKRVDVCWYRSHRLVASGTAAGKIASATSPTAQLSWRTATDNARRYAERVMARSVTSPSRPSPTQSAPRPASRSTTRTTRRRARPDELIRALAS